MTPVDTSAAGIDYAIHGLRSIACDEVGDEALEVAAATLRALLAERDDARMCADAEAEAANEFKAERDRLAAEVGRLREALRPFARINDEYEASNLDEHRPEWPSRDPGEVDLLVGRGGKRLLTLADCMTAYDALAGEGRGDG